MTWPVPLSKPPRVERIGYAMHGAKRDEYYKHPHLWCLHAYEYSCDVQIGEEVVHVLPGDVTLIPPGPPLRWHFPRERRRHHFALFHLDPGVTREIPVLNRIPRRMLHDFVELFRTVAHPKATAERKCAGLWELLWRLATLPHEEDASPEAQAAKLITNDLSAVRTVEELASEVGLTADHLTRRFRRRYGSTVIAWIRERRLALARDLLLQDPRPISAVAVACGIPDIQYFNKQIRARWGASPRMLRTTKKRSS